MKLGELHCELSAGRDVEIRGLALDSRRVEPGDLFFAFPGTQLDGRDFMADAAAAGAAAILMEPGYSGAVPDSVPVVELESLRDQVGTLASTFYGHPSGAMKVVGVTGTNGKSTCVWQIACALNMLGVRAGLSGTLGHGFPESPCASVLTTVDAVSLQATLAELRDAGATAAAIEVSSHGLEQGRANGIRFHTAVFTNLSHDHLDYHHDMNAYRAAKRRLFFMPGLEFAVLNADDDFGRVLIEELHGPLRVISYGIESTDADLRLSDIRNFRDGSSARIESSFGSGEFRTRLLGHFNLENLLAVTGTLVSLGLTLDSVLDVLPRLDPVVGRMQVFGGEGTPRVVVDYAHTPDALNKAMQALRAHTDGRLFCVFGCGGDRDAAKRPVMGGAAESLADVVILTDDNPRTEPGDKIIDDILRGMGNPERVIVERERRRAIERALTEAATEDVVLVAGKGHETYQIIGDARIAYSDIDTVADLISEAH
ncbi:MAG: UDP-N-acetylmuramoyl-L-alanyl-D-glutamate--2,6-diaminopimelate ligase [Pseudomonadales bacterium]